MNIALRVLIVDEHQMFREGIRSRLEKESDIQIVGEANSAQEAILLVEQTNPTVVTLDIRLPDASGIEVARVLRRNYPDVKVLILSAYDYDQYVEASFKIGVEGYLVKDYSQNVLIEALHEIAAGGVVIPPRIASKLVRSGSLRNTAFREQLPSALTMREMEVLELIVHAGLRNAEIAHRLLISPRTVEAHVSNIMSKLGAQNRTELLHIAIVENIIE
jgi:DNA-binding NarL/FixJ family response regulator